MNIRDLPRRLIKELASDCKRRYDEWWEMTEGKEFGTQRPISHEKIFEHAFSKGVSAMLSRLDEIKER